MTAQDIKETFSSLTLDPGASNFIGNVIGDQESSTDSNGKVTVTGDFANKSKLKIPDHQLHFQ